MTISRMFDFAAVVLGGCVSGIMLADGLLALAGSDTQNGWLAIGLGFTCLSVTAVVGYWLGRVR